MLRRILFGFAAVLTCFSLFAKPIAQSDNDVAPLLNGHHIPSVNLTSVDGKSYNLTELTQKKPTIFFFYRGGWCPFCNAQMGQLQAIQPKLIKMGFQIVGISPDTPEQLKASLTKNKLDYLLLSDADLKASKAFGVAFFTSARTTERFAKKADYISKFVAMENGEKRLVLPVPAIYVADKKGLIHFQYVNPNFRVRAEPELLMTAAELVMKKSK
ncbi:AhpC/TSA family protein [Parashewanella spongiae]|uniref:thioredoxin-dependent peroxiredoxin n=1 Tax=Parashewanella spongiae TaxID=342950 RepID=A0A3A6TY64_9GAMM|nr:peroxiredoxin-like family protein [Parashewanella spongiae]MCL1079007.1 AhpC/TSA family protein [Parashewanella spongiae]RJY17837.1 AhpC/TSA family protein [Parashewanella spongiae]